jgi:gamma-glutamyltranspeptidase/glutathione hydrolase
VYSQHGIVAASQPLAVQAGLAILAQGGTAADAAVATAAALNVTEPTSTGIGGDCFGLFYEAATGTISALNGSGRAPVGLSLDYLRAQGIEGELPAFHPHTITVPGACAGWFDLVERHGRLPMSDILAPAIRLAEQGFPVGPVAAYLWSEGVAEQLAVQPGGHELLIEGRAPRAGELFRNPGLARTLRSVADGGPKVFYEGAIAEAIISVVRGAGGVLSAQDLVAHRSTWDEPISTVYRGLRVWECPPNGQGLTALLALNLLEGFDLGAHDPLSAGRLHLVIEALRLAFADTRWYVADPAFNPAPLADLLSKSYAAARRQLIDPRRATLDQRQGSPVAGSDTVYLSVVDGAGNACSFINSNYLGFGTGIVPAGWGFTLHNRGHNFSLDPHHPNALQPGKRPYHTLIPGMVTREADDTLYACFGVMGAFMQPQGHVQVLLGLVDDGLDPQAALDRPRVCLADGRAGGAVVLEDGLPEATQRALAEMGHPTFTVSGQERAIFGRGQIILRDSATGVLTAGSDPRADGCAAPLLR